MPRTVYLLRHAKAEPLGDGTPDRERMLTKGGQHEAREIATAALGLKPKIGAIYCSPYSRCVQTAQPIAEELDLPIHTVASLGKYATPDPTFGYDMGHGGAILVCTHHEQLPVLVQRLTGTVLRRDKPATMVRLDLGDDGRGTLVWQARPGQLTKHPKRYRMAEYEDTGRTRLRFGDDTDGHWVTLHGSGNHVYIEDGRITKGPAALVGQSAEQATKGQPVTHHAPGAPKPTAEPSSAQTRAQAAARGVVVPPRSWALWINPDPTAKVQATWHDAKGRKQYGYSTQAVVARDHKKFSSVHAFSAALPRLREQMAHDLGLSDAQKARVAAAVVSLIDQAHIRVGSEKYAQENETFGASSLRVGHVAIKGADVTLTFTGKHGVHHTTVVHDAKTAQAIAHLKSLAGDDPQARLFRYHAADGSLHPLTEKGVNDYLSTFHVSAKQFRTQYATRTAAEMLAKAGAPTSDAEAKQTITRVVKAIAGELGNTPAVCRSSYINPAVLNAYSTGHLMSATQQYSAPATHQDDERFHAYLQHLDALLQAGTIADDDPFPDDSDISDSQEQPMPSRTYREYDQAERDAMGADDFAGPDKSFPIKTSRDVRNAASLLHHADDPAAVKARIVAIAKRKGLKLPKAWRKGGSTTATEPLRFEQPATSSVHVNAPIGATSDGDGTPASAKRKMPNRMLRRLVKDMRAHIGDYGYLDADAFESHVRTARGHSGGMAKAEKRNAQAAQTYAEPTCMVCGGPSDGWDRACSETCAAKFHENLERLMSERPDDWKSCKACKKGKTGDCTCPGCTAGTACWCCHGKHQMHAEGAAHLLSESGEGFRLFMPVSFAEAPDYIPYLPKPGTFTHPRYGKIEITPARNQEFVQNFNAGVYQKQIPLDGEHQTKLSGAMGWIQELRLNRDGSADARVEWTGRGRTMLSDNRFKYISPEWYDSWTAPDTGVEHKNVVIGGALTTRPYFKESALRPLVTAEDAIYVDGDDTPFSPNGQENPSMSKQNIEDLTPATQDQAKTFAEQIAALQAENATLKQASEAAAAEAKQAAEQVAAMQAEARRRQFTEQAKDWYGPVNEHVSFMESLSDEQMAFYTRQQRAYAEQLRDSALFSRFGRTGGADDGASNAEARLEAEVKKIQASENLSYHAAYAKALERNPKMYAEMDAGR